MWLEAPLAQGGGLGLTRRAVFIIEIVLFS
jgi:hypothetical protein